MLPSSRLHNPVNARIEKRADQPVLRQKAVFSPRNGSVSEWTLSRILKIKISRDTKQFFGRLLFVRSYHLLPFFSFILSFSY